LLNQEQQLAKDKLFITIVGGKMTTYIIKPRIKTPDGTILECKHRHDYQSYTDTISGEFYMVDGNGFYMRHSLNEVPFENLSITSDDTFEVIREHFTWGRNFDKDMNRLPDTEWIPLKGLETEHIKAILEGNWAKGYSQELMIRELDYRELKMINLINEMNDSYDNYWKINEN
jgi:hypothetical protein